MGKVSGVEDIKASSNGLRGHVAEELAGPEAGVTHETEVLLKFHGIYAQDDRDKRKALKAKRLDVDHMFMVRASVPGGALTGTQWLGLDEVADEVADGSLRLTTRQGVQYHFVRKGELRPLIGALNAKLVTTLAACGDVNRNVECCPAPLAGRGNDVLQRVARSLAERFRPQSGGYYDVWMDGEHAVTAGAQLQVVAVPGEQRSGTEQRSSHVTAGAQLQVVAVPGEQRSGTEQRSSHVTAGAQLQVVSAPEPLYGLTYLPRKFKIGIAHPGDNCIDVYANDFGAIPVEHPQHGPGFTVVVGGGMGAAHAREEDTYARLAEPLGWVREGDLGNVAEAVIAAFRDHGNREDRKRARLKYVIDVHGIDWFRAEVVARLQPGAELLNAVDVPAWQAADDHLGWHMQPDGRGFLGVHVDAGRVHDKGDLRIRTALRLAVQRYGVDLRLTANQNVLLINVEPRDREGLESLLVEHGVTLAEDLTALRRNAMACPALPTCGQALGEAERVLPQALAAVAAAFALAGNDEPDVHVRMTGCPNGCARPYNAEIGLVGRGKTTYDVYVGGSALGIRLNRRVAQDVKLVDITKVLGPIVERHLVEGHEGEGFGDFCARLKVGEPPRWEVATGLGQV